MNMQEIQDFTLEKSPYIAKQMEQVPFQINKDQSAHPHKPSILGREFQVLRQIRHKQNNSIQFSDFICLKQVQIKNRKNNHSFHHSDSHKKNFEQQLALLCRIKNDKDDSLNQSSKSSRNKILQSIKGSQNRLTDLIKPFNFLFPESNCNSFQIQENSFLQFKIKSLPITFSLFQSLMPISSFDWAQKFQSEMFCLNKFYRFLLNLMKPLQKLTEILMTSFNISIEQINTFFQNVLVQQNIFYENNSGTFYLLLIQNRPQKIHQKMKSPSKSFTKCQKIQGRNEYNLISIQKNLFKKISEIFWGSFFPSSKTYENQKNFGDIHTSFLQNFLASIIKMELSLDEAIQILESKQKRKSFINEKILISAKKVEKVWKAISINYQKKIKYGDNESSFTKNRYEQFSIPSGEFSEMNLFNEKLSKKRKSVHRKLTGKRNTIDVILQYSTQKNIPPSFESRSQEKKTRLFKHEAISKGKERKSQSFYHRQKNYDTINHSVDINVPSYANNINEKFSLMQSIQNKTNRKNVSKTIQIGEIKNKKTVSKGENSDKEIQENENSQQMFDSQSKYKLLNFLVSNVQPSDYIKKSSTQNITSCYTKTEDKNHKNPKNSDIQIQTSLNMQKRQSLAILAKNRRYYHINNFISSNNEQSIENLIANQKKILQQELKHSKSKEKQLLNRSQEKAFSIFNKEVQKLNKTKDKSQQITNNENLSNEIKQKASLNTTDRVASYLMKKSSNSKTRYDENSEPKVFEDRLLYSKKMSDHTLNEFSPPKKHKSMHGMQVQMSPKFNGRELEEEKKIDDREFRQKFTQHFNRKSITQEDQLNDLNQTNEIISSQNPRAVEISNIEIKKRQQPQIKLSEQIRQIIEEKKYISINAAQRQELVQKIDMKVNNQYLAFDDQLNLGQEVPHSSKRLDRTEKGLINAAKKLNSKINNKNFNVEGIFAEQEMLAQQQQETRKLSSRQIKEDSKRKYSESKANQEQNIRKFSTNSLKVEFEKNNDLLKPKNAEDSSLSRQRMLDASISEHLPNIQKNEELKEAFSQLAQLISPIKPSSKNAIAKDIQKQKQIDANQKPFSSCDTEKKQNFSVPKPSPKIQSNSQLQTKQNDDNSKPIKQNELNQTNKHTTNKPQPITHPKIIQKLDDTKIQQAVFIERKPSVSSQSKPSQNIFDLNKSKSNTNLNEQSLPIKQVKQLTKRPQITEDDEFELEEIKFTPAKPKILEKTISNQTKLEKLIEKQSETQSKHGPPNLSKPPLPHEANSKSFSRQGSQPKIAQQIPASPVNSTNKNSKSGKRQGTVESVASSFGPHKSVKKIVEEYVFMVNKIGEAVAKTPKIAKKVQTVTDWYVGAYFLYKRFLYERKKMQKYLKEGTPKLTRYDEEINLDEWKEYLKSPERHTLMTKVSEQNINIGKSIQRMQTKLLSKSIPQSIKQHAAISQRTSRQSVIAVDAVIDQFDCLVEKGMLNDEDIVAHCTEMFNACLIIAELDQLVEDIVPVSEFNKSKRTSEELQMIAQDLYDLYHDE